MRATNHHLLRAYVIKTPPFWVVFCFGLERQRKTRRNTSAVMASISTGDFPAVIGWIDVLSVLIGDPHTSRPLCPEFARGSET